MHATPAKSHDSDGNDCGNTLPAAAKHVNSAVLNSIRQILSSQNGSKSAFLAYTDAYMRPELTDSACIVVR